MFEVRPGQNMIEKEGNDGESLKCTKVVCYCGIIILCIRLMFMDFVDHPYPRMYVKNVYQKNNPPLSILMQQTSYWQNDVPKISKILIIYEHLIGSENKNYIKVINNI